MYTQTNTTRRVSSASIAAYLIASALVPLEVLPGRCVTFLFDDVRGRATALLTRWATGQATVEARAYVTALHQAYNAIHHHRTEGAQ